MACGAAFGLGCTGASVTPTTGDACTAGRKLDILGFPTMPSSVVIKVSSGTREIASHQLSPTYEQDYPNGRRCDDGCRMGFARFEL